MRFIDLFAGIGGFRLGFERAGFKCVYSCEIDEKAATVYEKNFGDNPLGDITKIKGPELPEFEILLAGFSCQPFSIAGERKGFSDKERGTLFFDILRIVQAKKPKVIVLENVKNLLSIDSGESFKLIKRSLEKEDYIVTYKVLNAKDFGVAQNRERLIIVATLRGVGSFNFNQLNKMDTIKLKDILKKDGEMEYLSTHEYTIIESPKVQKTGIIFSGYLKDKNLRSRGVDQSKVHLSRVHKQFNRIYSEDGIMCTLMAQESSGRYWVQTTKGVRKLTRDECKLLMGFPEEFIIEGNQKDYYRFIGNSIVVPMVEEIAKVIKELF